MKTWNNWGPTNTQNSPAWQVPGKKFQEAVEPGQLGNIQTMKRLLDCAKQLESHCIGDEGLGEDFKH